MLGLLGSSLYILSCLCDSSSDDIPGWMIWLYYLSPFSWCINALLVNEMTSPPWMVPLDPAQDGGPLLGPTMLGVLDFRTDRAWIWYCVAYLVGYTLMLTAVSVWGLARCQLQAQTPQVGCAGACLPVYDMLRVTFTCECTWQQGTAIPANLPSFDPGGFGSFACVRVQQ